MICASKTSLQFEKLSRGPKQLRNSLILPVNTREGVRPAGGISPLACMSQNGLPLTPCSSLPADYTVASAVHQPLIFYLLKELIIHFDK